MIKPEIVYTDGHGVVITPTEFKVNRLRYSLPAIIRHGLTVIRPLQLAGVLIAMIGIAFILLGIQFWITPPASSEIVISGMQLHVWRLCIWTGASIVIAGLLLYLLLRERYAVRIVTGAGEALVLVSRKREYVIQIVNALSRAIRMGHHTKSKLSGTVYL